jgi:hypothetical protein
VAWKPDYLTLGEAKAYLRIADAVDDAELPGWITAVSRAIDDRCNRQFGQLAAPAARTYRRPAYYVPEIGMWQLDVDDVQDSIGLLVAGVAYAASGAVLLPDNAPADNVPWTALGFESCPTVPMAVTARWGWAAFPAQVPAACKLQLNRLNSRRDSPFGIAGSPDQGSELRLLARLDPDVSTTLRRLGRRRRAG